MRLRQYRKLPWNIWPACRFSFYLQRRIPCSINHRPWRFATVLNFGFFFFMSNIKQRPEVTRSMNAAHDNRKKRARSSRNDDEARSQNHWISQSLSQLSAEQLAVVDDVAVKKQNAAVLAVAGSGKTRTAFAAADVWLLAQHTGIPSLEALPHCDMNLEDGNEVQIDDANAHVLVIAYNRRLRNETAERLLRRGNPRNAQRITICTFHELACKYYQHRGTFKDSSSIESCLGDVISGKAQLRRHLLPTAAPDGRTVTRKRTPFAKASFNQNDPDSAGKPSVPPFGLIILDEAQDITPEIHSFFIQFLCDLADSYPRLPSPQLMLLGDPFQLLYGYRGALTKYLHDPRESFQSARISPLSKKALISTETFKHHRLSYSYRITHEMASWINANLNPEKLLVHYSRWWSQQSDPTAVLKTWGEGIKAAPSTPARPGSVIMVNASRSAQGAANKTASMVTSAASSARSMGYSSYETAAELFKQQQQQEPQYPAPFTDVDASKTGASLVAGQAITNLFSEYGCRDCVVLSVSNKNKDSPVCRVVRAIEPKHLANKARASEGSEQQQCSSQDKSKLLTNSSRFVVESHGQRRFADTWSGPVSDQALDDYPLLTTVNAFKGLERKAVVLAGFDSFLELNVKRPQGITSGCAKSKPSTDPADQDEEEEFNPIALLNKFYVAATRAQEKLIVIQFADTPFSTARELTLFHRSNLTEQQQEVVAAIVDEGKNCIVNACAGSGKTRTAITTVIHWLQRHFSSSSSTEHQLEDQSGDTSPTVLSSSLGVNEQALIVAYNRALADDMGEQARKAVPSEVYRSLRVSTIHSVSHRLFGCGKDDLDLDTATELTRPPIDEVPPWGLVVLDEFQDFTPGLFNFVMKLLLCVTLVRKHFGAGPPQILILGDVFQRIYGFRGARAEFLLCADKLFQWFDPRHPRLDESQLLGVLSPSPPVEGFFGIDEKGEQEDSLENCFGSPKSDINNPEVAVADDESIMGPPLASMFPYYIEDLAAELVALTKPLLVVKPGGFVHKRLSICFRITHEAAQFINRHLNPNNLEKYGGDWFDRYRDQIQKWWGDGIHANPNRPLSPDSVTFFNRHAPENAGRMGLTTRDTVCQFLLQFPHDEDTVILAKTFKNAFCPVRVIVNDLSHPNEKSLFPFQYFNFQVEGGSGTPAAREMQDTRYGHRLATSINRFKGREAKGVVLLDFDHFAAERLTDDSRLELFNKHYVACTRATEKLLIVQYSEPPYITHESASALDGSMTQKPPWIPRHVTDLLEFASFNRVLSAPIQLDQAITELLSHQWAQHDGKEFCCLQSKAWRERKGCVASHCLSRTGQPSLFCRQDYIVEGRGEDTKENIAKILGTAMGIKLQLLLDDGVPCIPSVAQLQQGDPDDDESGEKKLELVLRRFYCGVHATIKREYQGHRKADEWSWRDVVSLAMAHDVRASGYIHLWFQTLETLDRWPILHSQAGIQKLERQTQNMVILLYRLFTPYTTEGHQDIGQGGSGAGLTQNHGPDTYQHALSALRRLRRRIHLEFGAQIRTDMERSGLVTHGGPQAGNNLLRGFMDIVFFPPLKKMRCCTAEETSTSAEEEDDGGSTSDIVIVELKVTQQRDTDHLLQLAAYTALMMCNELGGYNWVDDGGDADTVFFQPFNAGGRVPSRHLQTLGHKPTIFDHHGGGICPLVSSLPGEGDSHIVSNDQNVSGKGNEHVKRKGYPHEEERTWAPDSSRRIVSALVYPQLGEADQVWLLCPPKEFLARLIQRKLYREFDNTLKFYPLTEEEDSCSDTDPHTLLEELLGAAQ